MDIERIRSLLEILDNEISLKITKDVPLLDLHGFSLGPYQTDDHIILDRWQGEILIKHGYAIEVDSLTEGNISKIFWEDHKSRELAQIGDCFYYNLKNTLYNLFNRSVTDKKLYQIYSKTLRDSRSLLESRTKKIVDLALSQKKQDIDHLQIPEKSLYNILYTSIRNWKDFIDTILLVER